MTRKSFDPKESQIQATIEFFKRHGVELLEGGEFKELEQLKDNIYEMLKKAPKSLTDQDYTFLVLSYTTLIDTMIDRFETLEKRVTRQTTSTRRQKPFERRCQFVGSNPDHRQHVFRSAT